MLKKIIFIACFCLVAFVIGFVFLLNKNMNRPINLDKATLVTVEAGTSLSSFSQELVDKQWIKNRFWLRSYARLYPDKSQIKSGTFNIPAHISLKGLIEQLAKGKEHQFSITFVEGSTFKQWLVQLEQQPNLTDQLSNLSVKKISALLDIKPINPEGWFFPETYSYTKGTSSLTILQRAHNEMKNTLESLWESRAQNLPYKNAYQALIMASIIEKETSVVDEMPLISSVFVNRLRKKMRLQTDPTVIYGLGDRYQGDIKKIHLREKTPYNTYRINGLPPTPIAMPGKLAIKAALNPDTTDYLYFVSMGNGAHVFSTNLVEHNKAVVKYQLRKQ